MTYTKAEFAQAVEWQLAMVRRQEREAQRKAFIEEARQYDPPPTQWWTIAFDGEIGHFGATRDKAKAERVAVEYVGRYGHSYTVAPEDPDEPKRETL